MFADGVRKFAAALSRRIRKILEQSPEADIFFYDVIYKMVLISHALGCYKYVYIYLCAIIIYILHNVLKYRLDIN